jgi:hypothetical protein
MGRASIIVFFLTLLLIGAVFSGCIASQDNSDALQKTNQTAAAITIALNNETVKTYLKGNWSVASVSLNAKVSFLGKGEEVKYLAPDVIIDTETANVHVYVNLSTKSVVYIWDNPKRSPMPIKRPPKK